MLVVLSQYQGLRIHIELDKEARLTPVGLL